MGEKEEGGGGKEEEEGGETFVKVSTLVSLFPLPSSERRKERPFFDQVPTFPITLNRERRRELSCCSFCRVQWYRAGVGWRMDGERSEWCSECVS